VSSSPKPTYNNNNNNNKPCIDYSDTVTIKVFQGHFTKLYHITVSLPEKRWLTVLSSISGGTQAVTGFPWPKLEENSVANDDVLVHQPSTEVSIVSIVYIIGVYYVQEGGVCPGPEYTTRDSLVGVYSGLLHRVNDANVVDLPCLNNPCKHGGTCVSQADLTSYKCECVQPFHGKNCEQCKCTV